MEKTHGFLVLISFFQAFSLAKSQPLIGLNYGEVADNLPPASSTASLLQSITITSIRLYGSDPSIISALAGTNISILVGAANADIPSLAADPAAAVAWIAANVLPFAPTSRISAVSVGNEVLSSGDPNLVSSLLPAMKNLRSAAGSIKISTVHSMAVLSQSDPPSSGAFHPDIAGDLAGILGFLQETGSPFMINPYPYFAYQSDPRPETLAFCVFQPNAGRIDAGSGIRYDNMFDAQVDAIRSAVNAAGFPAVEIVVAETGWPYRGDGGEVGATVENARAFNGGLVSHLRSMGGTPLMPGRSVETYIFALYDEDLKPGPTSERSFGLFLPDLSPIYDAGLLRSSSNQVSSSVAPPTPAAVTPPPSCIPGANQDVACVQPISDCSPNQARCYIPSAAESPTAFAMSKNIWNVHLRHLISRGPSSSLVLKSRMFGFLQSLLLHVANSCIHFIYPGGG